MRRRALKLLLSLAAAGAILAVLGSQVGWRAILEAAAAADPGLAVLGGVLAFLGLVFVGLAWWIAVREATRTTVGAGLRLFFATLFANFLTPFGQMGGEPVIAALLSQTNEHPIEENLGTVVGADLLNTVPFFTLTLAGILATWLLYPDAPYLGPLLALVLALLGIVVLLAGVLWFAHDDLLAAFGSLGAGLRRLLVALRLPRRWLRRIHRDRFERMGRGFLAALRDATDDPKTVGIVLGLNHLASLVDVLALLVFLQALGIDGVNWAALLLVFPASMLATFLPLPGGLGGVEVALVGLLVAVVAVPVAAASAATLLFRVVNYGGGLVIGAVASASLSVDLLAPPEPDTRS